MEENQEIIENAELNMMAAITHLETELSKIRAGKANPVMLKGISVEYYGNLTPLNQVASVSTPNAQTISIQPWEKSIIDEIEKSIIDSNLGFNPVNNGESILIILPSSIIATLSHNSSASSISVSYTHLTLPTICSV